MSLLTVPDDPPPRVFPSADEPVYARLFSSGGPYDEGLYDIYVTRDSVSSLNEEADLKGKSHGFFTGDVGTNTCGTNGGRKLVSTEQCEYAASLMGMKYIAVELEANRPFYPSGCYDYQGLCNPGMVICNSFHGVFWNPDPVGMARKDPEFSTPICSLLPVKPSTRDFIPHRPMLPPPPSPKPTPKPTPTPPSPKASQPALPVRPTFYNRDGVFRPVAHPGSTDPSSPSPSPVQTTTPSPRQYDRETSGITWRDQPWRDEISSSTARPEVGGDPKLSHHEIDMHMTPQEAHAQRGVPMDFLTIAVGAVCLLLSFSCIIWWYKRCWRARPERPRSVHTSVTDEVLAPSDREVAYTCMVNDDEHEPIHLGQIGNDRPSPIRDLVSGRSHPRPSHGPRWFATTARRAFNRPTSPRSPTPQRPGTTAASSQHSSRCRAGTTPPSPRASSRNSASRSDLYTSGNNTSYHRTRGNSKYSPRPRFNSSHPVHPHSYHTDSHRTSPTARTTSYRSDATYTRSQQTVYCALASSDIQNMPEPGSKPSRPITASSQSTRTSYRPALAASATAPRSWAVDNASIPFGGQQAQGVDGLVELTSYRLLGKGSFGECYLSEMDGIQVVIKAPIKEVGMESIRKEAGILATLPRHPCVIDYFGWCYVNHRGERNVGVVYAYYRGGSMWRYLKRGHLNWASHDGEIHRIYFKRLCSFARDIAAGVKFLHQSRVIHRDLAARNILVELDNAQPRAIVGDIGFAKAMDDESQEPHHDGKPASCSIVSGRWAAPEVLRGGSDNYSFASDVWSFGVVIWEMLTAGETPWPEMKENHPRKRRILQHITENTLDTPHRTPTWITKLVAKCLEREVERRPHIAHPLEVIKAELKKM